jgi:hypothetical protein
VVASRLPVIERYVGASEVGFAEPGDPASIAAVIEAVRADPRAARDRALNAAERLAAMEWRRQRRGYLAFVDGLVDAGKPLPARV